MSTSRCGPTLVLSFLRELKGMEEVIGVSDQQCFRSFFFPQLCKKVLVLDMTQMDCFAAERFPNALKTMLENPKVVPVGVNVSVDTASLADLGVHVKTRVDMRQQANLCEPKHNDGHGMQKLCSRMLNLHVDK